MQKKEVRASLLLSLTSLVLKILQVCSLCRLSSHQQPEATLCLSSAPSDVTRSGAGAPYTAQFLTWVKRKVDSIKSLQLKKVPMNGYKESESTIMVAGDKRMQTGVQGTLNAALHITGPPLAVDETRGSTTEAYSGLACLSLALPVE
jgi:hypothetical protein